MLTNYILYAKTSIKIPCLNINGQTLILTMTYVYYYCEKKCSVKVIVRFSYNRLVFP